MRTRIHFVVAILASILVFGPSQRAFADAKDDLEQARAYEEKGRYEQAEQVYKAIVAGQVGSDYGLEAQEKLTCLYATWGKEPEARASLDELLADYSQHKRISTAVTHVADTYRANGNHQKACEIYADVIAAWPEDEHAMWSQMGLTISYASLGNDAAARSAFALLRSQYTAQEHISRAVCLVGDHFRKTGKHKKACELYEDVLTTWPEAEFALWARMGEAISQINLRDFEAARAAVERLRGDFDENKNLSAAACFTADEYRKAGKYSEAAELYNYVVQEYPGAEHAFWSQTGLAICHIRLNDDAGAMAATEAIKGYSEGKDERIPTAIRQVADEYRSLNRHEEAFELYGYVVENYADSKEALWSQMNTAILQIDRSRGTEGDAAVQKLLADFSADSDAATAICWIGDEYRAIGHYEKACELYQQVISGYPEAEHALWSQMNLAVSNIRLERYDAAKAAANKLLADYSQDERLPSAARTLGDEYRQNERLTEAFELYEYVVANYAGTQEALWSQMNLAISKLSFDDPNADIETERLLARDSKEPGMPAAVCWVADQYRRSGRADKATKLYDRVMAEYPDTEYAMWSRMGLVILDIHPAQNDTVPDVNDAVDRLIADFNDQPELANAVFQVGEEYYYRAFEDANKCQTVKSVEDINNAKNVWEKIIAQCPQSKSIGLQHAHYFTAVCCRRLGQYENALAHYQTVVDNWPGYQYAWSAQCLIGECYEQLRRSGKIEESEANAKIMQAYKAVIDRYPESPLVGQACIRLANMSFKARQWNEAAMYFGLFLEKCPGDVREVTALYHLGKTYENMGELDTAIEVYRMFLEGAEPGDHRIRYVIDKLEELRGQER